MANMLKREREEKGRRRSSAAVRASWGKRLIAALLVVTMSTMGYSPAIAVANGSHASEPALTTASDEADTTTATTDSETSQPADSSASEPAQDPADSESADPEEGGSPEESGQSPSSQSASSASASASSASSTSASASSASAQAAELPKAIERTLASTSGGRYTVKVAYDKNAGIPDGSTVEIVEYTQEPSDPHWRDDPAYADRPLPTEQIVSKDYLAQRTTVAAKGLGAQDTDYAFFAKFLDVAIMHDGQRIVPRTAVQLTIETTGVDVACSDGLGLVRMVRNEGLAGNEQAVKDGLVSSDGKSATSLDAENLTYDADAATGRSAADDKVVKLQCSTTELGELAVVGVAVPKATLWQEGDAKAQVLGPASQGVHGYEIGAAGLDEGEELLGAQAFQTSPTRDYGTMLWARVVALDGKSAVQGQAVSGLVGYHVQGGSAVGNSVAMGNPDGVLAFKATEGFALVRQRATAASGTASASGASGAARESGYINEEGLLQRNLPAQNGGTYVIKVSYGPESGVPEGATLQARELSVLESQQHRAGVDEALGGDAVISTRYLDLSILDSSGRKVEPTGAVSVSITLADTVVSGDVSIVHFGEEGPQVVMLEQQSVSAAAGMPVDNRLLNFTTDSFSVYAIVTVTPASPVAGSPATEIEEGVGYYLSNGDGGNRRYMLDTVYNDANPNGLRKINSALPEDATLFYFEKADDAGHYYVYSLRDGVPYYLYMEYYTNDEGHLRMSTEKVSTLTVEPYNASNGLYLISGTDNGKTWYVNQHAGTNGVRFAGWKNGFKDNGSHIRLTKVENDPLALDGQEYALVNQDAYAVSTTVTAANGFSGLLPIAVSKTEEGIDGTASYRTVDSADYLPLWRFTAQEGGTYYVSTMLDGKPHYLNIGAATGNKTGAHITLSTTPQRLNVAMTNDKIAISAQGGTNNAKVNYNTNANPVRFSGWAQGDVTSAAVNELFSLGTPGPGMIVYRYADPERTAENADDPLEHTVADAFGHDEWAEGYTVRSTCTMKSYSSDKRYTYSVDHWVDDNGVVYAPGQPIVSKPESALYLTPVWKLDEVSDRVVTLNYYNELFSADTPSDTDQVFFSHGDAGEYVPQSTVNDFYSQSEGKIYHSAGSWLTESGEVVEPLAGTIDLGDFKYYADGNYESIKLVAQWETRVDPWNIAGQSFVIVNDRFDATGYTADERYLSALASTKTSGNVTGLDKMAVLYDATDKTCTSTQDMPALWLFEAQDDGTYTIKDSQTGTYLNIDNGNTVRVSSTAQHLDVRDSYDLDRYILMKNGQNVVLNYSHNGGNGLFRGWNMGYSAATGSKDARFILAPVKSSVVYYYDPYSGADAHPADASVNLPETAIDYWSEGYTVKSPSQDTYQADDGTYLWKYRFSHWKTDAGSAMSPGASVATEPSPALGLHAVWTFEGKEYAPIALTYTVQRASTNTGYYERLVDGTNLPGVDGLIMTPGSGDRELRSYAGEETVTGATVGSYEVRDLTSDSYITKNGKKYRFAGWQVTGSDDAQTIAPTTTIDLSTLDTNHDHVVSLVSVWTEDFKDPWGLDGSSYLIVYNNYVALSATSASMDSRDALGAYRVQKTDTSMPVYQVQNSTDSHVMWQFDAQDDGTYLISTMVGTQRQYLVTTFADAFNQSGALLLSLDPLGATRFRLCKVNNTYEIWAMGENYVKSTLDARSGSGPFMVWGKRSGEVGQRFNLGLPDKRTVVYQYPPYEGTYEDVSAPPADATTNLPAATMEYCDAATFTVSQPALKFYYARDSLHRWVYQFDTWQDNAAESQKTYAPGDTATSPTDVMKLNATWRFLGKADIPKTVHYALNFNGTPIDAPHLSKLGLVDNAEVVPVENVGSYSVCNVDPGYYKTAAGRVYEFVGWQDESGNMVGANSVIDVSQADYDTDGDDVITLKAVWNNHYINGANSDWREARFYVSVKALSADAFNDDASISTVSADFTKEIHYSLIGPADMPNPRNKAVAHPELNNQVCYPIVNYFNETEEYKNTVTIAEADRRIRSMAEGGLYIEGEEGEPGQTYKLLDFPSDEEVLEQLKSAGNLTLDGVRVDPQQINSENFTIRWYVCKYQIDSGCWCWHIDGKLTPNLSYLKVEKTFAGDENALANIPSNYTINLSNATQSESGIVSADKMMSVNLVLNDQTASAGTGYGLIEGTPANGTYGYTGREGDAYTWLIPVARGGMYDVIEKNYNISTSTASYGIAAQYSVTETQGDVEGATRTPWFGTVTGYSAKYPRTSIDVKNTSNIQSINLYNTYVETGTFVIQKIDVGVDGLQDIAMPGVKFAVSQYDEDGYPHPVAITQQRKGVDGRYNVDLYGDGEVSNVVTTGADGSIYLKVKKADGVEGEVDDEALYTFTFTEMKDAATPGVPEGYLERTDGQAPTFTMYVDANGNFAVDSNSIVTPEGGGISLLKAGGPEVSEDEAIVIGATVTNRPKQLSVTANKVWQSALVQSNVTVQLDGRVNGVTRIRQQAVLDGTAREQGAPLWSHTWDALPMMMGNRKVNYTVTETKIGPYAAGTATFTNNWSQKYDYEYLNADGDAANDFTTERIIVNVTNIDPVTNTRSVILQKVDAGHTSLGGAVFNLHRGMSADSMIATDAYGNALRNLESGANGTIWLGQLAEGIYYLHELSPQDRWFVLTIGEDGVTCVSA